MKKHQKHTALARPSTGFFGRNEYALVGAPCGDVQQLAAELINQLVVPESTYVDADHTSGDSDDAGLSHNEFTDKIRFVRFDKQKLNDFDRKILLNDQNLIFVNGNHFQAAKQLVLIHPKKEASLKKRIGQLTDIRAYILCGGAEKPFDWLKELIADQPVFHIHETEKIAAFIRKSILPAPIKGLVLAGGKSIRMGEDKGQIHYHGIPQTDYLLREFENAGIEAFVSCRANQYENYKRITDKFDNLGPFGAIVSAFQADPDAAWLVVACDLPRVNASVFRELIRQRNIWKTATAFYNAATEFPDPLLTLWEPKAYIRLMQFVALGYSCPRKVLINSDIELISPPDPQILKNVNTPEERADFLS
jgi:molybdopterin-guanine dinucleotide biosynthesis protein A